MKLLLIDTCGRDGSVALAEPGRAEPIVVRSVLEGRSASERLLPEVRRLMAEAAWGVDEVEVVGVVSGPGSFTGVRVGLAAAKGLCEGWGAQMVAVSRLEVLARKGSAAHAVLDAGRGEFFYGGYAAGETWVEALLGREEVLRTLAGTEDVAVTEEGVQAALAGRGLVVVGALEAADALPLVLERAERGAFSDIASVDANYLRSTEIEVLERLRLRSAER